MNKTLKSIKLIHILFVLWAPFRFGNGFRTYCWFVSYMLTYLYEISKNEAGSFTLWCKLMMRWNWCVNSCYAKDSKIAPKLRVSWYAQEHLRPKKTGWTESRILMPRVSRMGCKGGTFSFGSVNWRLCDLCWSAFDQSRRVSVCGVALSGRAPTNWPFARK